jgi:hypothetical protein
MKIQVNFTLDYDEEKEHATLKGMKRQVKRWVRDVNKDYCSEIPYWSDRIESITSRIKNLKVTIK